MLDIAFLINAYIYIFTIYEYIEGGHMVTIGGKSEVNHALSIDDTNYLINSMEIANEHLMPMDGKIPKNTDDTDAMFGNQLTMGMINQNIQENDILSEMAMESGNNNNNNNNNKQSIFSDNTVVTKGDYQVNAMKNVSYFIDKTHSVDLPSRNNSNLDMNILSSMYIYTILIVNYILSHINRSCNNK